MIKFPGTDSLALHRTQNPEIVKALLKVNPAAAIAKDRSGAVPLHYSSTLNVCQLLITASKEACGMANNEGMLPLHIALDRSRPKDMIRALIKAHPAAVRTPAGVDGLQWPRPDPTRFTSERGVMKPTRGDVQIFLSA